MLYAASPEKWNFYSGKEGGEEVMGGRGARPPLSEFSGSAPTIGSLRRYRV